MGQGFLEQLQDEHCDETRTTGKRFRVMRNIGEAAQYFPIGEPVLCFGSGHRFEVEVWRLLGFDAIGCELSARKRAIAAGHGVKTIAGLAEIESPVNIYCAHTIEHLQDAGAVLAEFAERCVSTVAVIFPIEPRGTRNPSHLTPVKSLDSVSLPGMHVALKAQRWNDEHEGILICIRT